MTASAPKTVLVVDDSSVMRQLVSEIVASDPDLKVVDVAENGRVALQKARQYKPDCVLLDLEMPELSGLDTMRRLRLRSAVKIVVLSRLGHEAARLRAEALRLGAADVIDKPTSAISGDLRATRGNQIRATLRRVLDLPPIELARADLGPAGGSTTASLLSVDLRSTGALVEQVEATALVELLNENLALIEQVVRKHGGIVDTHLDGSTLAVFGVPQACADHAARAMAAAAELLPGLEARRAERRQAGEPFAAAGLLIVTGVVVAGELGPPRDRRFRTLGGASETTARLGRVAVGYGADLVICGRTLGALAAAAPPVRRLDVLQVEADAQPVTLYEVLLAPTKFDAASLEIYARGIELYEGGHFGKAAKAFDDLLLRQPADGAATHLRARCRSMLLAPAGTWRGVWPLDGPAR